MSLAALAMDDCSGEIVIAQLPHEIVRILALLEAAHVHAVVGDPVLGNLRDQRLIAFGRQLLSLMVGIISLRERARVDTNLLRHACCADTYRWWMA